MQKSLSKTLKENKLDPSLMEKLNVAFNGKYNVNKIRKGDTLQFIYDQLSINGQFLNYGHVQAICIKTRKKSIYAVDYFLKDDSSYQYVDDAGKYLKTSFLKSPLKKGGSIVSRFSLRRFHPILQVEKAHLGTDFAAPQGTPIIATASGVIEAAQFTHNNGKYVKIRHDRRYETQYLHMSRFARGIRKGVRVQQGQVIGFVGSTGLATGPHVCYRFWKHGAQVDPLREKLNVVRQVPKKELNDYLAYFTAVKQALETISIR
ncbi:MAG: M23 family metallopeptidase [Sphingobacteriales bacterium]|nr:M23 family metallopeptidase [Sphingobacteriales bacterium]